VKNNKTTQFLALYEPVHNSFYRYCRIITGNNEDADDLIQDSLLVMLERHEKIGDISMFKPYLFKVAGNLYKMKRRRYKFKADFNEVKFNQLKNNEISQERAVDFQLMYDKLLLLPAKISEAMIMFYVVDLSLEEIQKIQGGTLSGVKQRLKRGREKLLAMLNTKKEMEMASFLFML
jgi:RNA polymerase sigma factor (sigma-70 family)